MENPDNAIEVRNVGKKFKLSNKNKTLKDFLTYHDDSIKTRTVLNDISFNVKKGETLGIIGRNGSGKSTMLKLLTGILYPNEGTIETKGKIACLIELGAGFHPDMTGRENVYINASIFGVPKKLVEKRFDDIIEFSGIGEYIDERVRNYSSGMYMRLAFSVAINVDADILLIDEILAVGDMQFQEKCFNKLNEFKEKGGTIVLVSHSNEKVKAFCDKALWINDGKLRSIGDAKTVCDEYENFMMNDPNSH